VRPDRQRAYRFVEIPVARSLGSVAEGHRQDHPFRADVPDTRDGRKRSRGSPRWSTGPGASRGTAGIRPVSQRRLPRSVSGHRARWGNSPASNRQSRLSLSTRFTQFALLIDRPKLKLPVSDGYRRRPTEGKRKGCRSLDTPSHLAFRSLRGLDLNQRPLGYEYCISGSAQAYPLLTGGVRSCEITSDHVSQPQFSHKNQDQLPGELGERVWEAFMDA
jgi:hypothetical protein